MTTTKKVDGITAYINKNILSIIALVIIIIAIAILI